MNQRQIVFALSVTMVGLVLGGLWGLRQDAGFEARHIVMADQAMQTPVYEAGPRAAAFIIAMNREETRDRAAEATGLSSSDFEGIFAAGVEDSPLLEVIGTADVSSGLGDRIAALSEATLLELIDQERAASQVIVDATASELAELNQQLDEYSESTGVARDGDLESRLEGDLFNLDSSIQQLANQPEDETYWTVRLPGEITALNNRIESVTEVLDSWRITSDRIEVLADSSGSAEERLIKLDLAEDIVRSGSATLASEPSPLSARIAAGRWAAVGGAVAFIGSLGILAAGTLATRRKPRPAASDVTAPASS